MSVHRILNERGRIIVGIETPLEKYPPLYAELVNLQNQIDAIAPSADAMLKSANLSDVDNLVTAQTNIGVTAINNYLTSNALLKSANNLNDVFSVPQARTNLGLGSAALLNSNQILQVANNLSDVASASASRANLGLGSAALLNSNQILQVANNLSDVASASASRANLGLGSAALLNSNQILQVANNLSDVADVSTSRANIGADNASNLTTGTLSNALLPSSTLNPLALVGVVDGSNASAGNVGEYFSSVMNRSARIVCVAGDQIINSLVLGAGDFDVWGVAYYEADGASTIITQVTGGINNSNFGAPDLAQRVIYNNPSLYNICSFPLPVVRVSSSSPQTVYGWSLVTQNAGTVKASYSLYARRVR